MKHRERFRAAWRDDPAFIAVAAQHWADDLASANRGGYDRGATQKLTYRYQGWLAGRAERERLGPPVDTECAPGGTLQAP
jgi:hypothetical protein